MPSRGISWTREQVPSIGKALAGEFVTKHYPSHDGLYTQSSERRLGQFLDDILPQLRPYFNSHSTCEKNTFEKTMLRRGYFCQPPSPAFKDAKNEIEFFRHRRWSPFMDLVSRALVQNKPIKSYDLAEAEEQRLILRYDGWPAAYIRQDLDNPCMVYIGSCTSIADRNVGHLNAQNYLTDVLPTGDKMGALTIESFLHVLAPKLGAERHREMSKTRGLWRFPRGVDGAKLLRTHIRDNDETRVLLRGLVRAA